MYVLVLPIRTLKLTAVTCTEDSDFTGRMVDQFVTHTPASPAAMDHHSILEAQFLKHSEKSVSSNVKLETEMQK